MKFVCRCGNAIVDGDASPDKAWLIADQDVEELRARPKGADALALARPIHRCTACGRLSLADPVTGETVFFAPEPDSPARSPLGSRLGNAYPVTLIGGWKDWLSPPSGDLFWGSSGDVPGGFETFASVDALTGRYHAVLEMLQRQKRLGSAWLHRGDVTLHRWPG